MDRRLGWEIERIILLVIIVLGVLSFFNALSQFWSYVMNVIGWTTIAYIIYIASPTELFFGERRGVPDLLIVLSYVLLSAKTFVSTAVASLPQLMATASSYVKVAHTNLTSDIFLPVSSAEFNSFALNIVPDAGKLAQFAAQNLTIAQQQMTIMITNGSHQMGLLMTPTTLDGTMLMFYNSVAQNAALIQMATVVLGMLILMCVSIYTAYRIPVKKPSILSAVKEEGEPNPMRAVWLFLLLVGFFVMVFNLLFEWMSITDDTVLLIIVILIMLFTMLVRSNFRTDEFLERLGNLGEEFYTRVLHLFTESKTLLLGVSGFLVLHLLTDVGNFLAPAIAGYQTIYAQQLEGSHASLYAMITGSIGNGPLPDALTITAYALSTAGIIILLTMPAIIWYKLFKLRTTGSHDHIPDWKPWHIGIVLACVLAYLLVPVFSISAIHDGEFVGVNSTSTPIAQHLAVTTPLCLALGIFILCVALGHLHDYARRVLMLGPFGIAIAFFGVYVYQFFTSSFVYYAQSLVLLLRNGQYILMPFMFTLFALTIVFYVTGFFSFLYEIWRD